MNLAADFSVDVSNREELKKSKQMSYNKLQFCKVVRSLQSALWTWINFYNLKICIYISKDNDYKYV